MIEDLDTIFATAVSRDEKVTDTIKWLIKNRVLMFSNNLTKWGQSIPFDIRAERASTTSHMTDLGDTLADRVIEIEKELNTKFDSMLCSLYCGMFTGFSTALALRKKHNREVNVSASRRDFHFDKKGENNQSDFMCIQCKAHYPYDSLFQSTHPRKDKSIIGSLGKNVLIHDEMVNSGNTVRELIDICNIKNVIPKAMMVLVDRILDPLPEGYHVRMIDAIPCYSMITHYEIVEWCHNNQEIWKLLYDQS
jgi:orotate phosphoribosyltransferase